MLWHKKFYTSKLKKPFHKNILPALIALIVVLCITIGSVAAPKKLFSQISGQLLSSFPKFSVANWKNGTYERRMENYLEDHILFRETCTRTVNQIRVWTGTQEIGNIFLLKDRFIRKIPEKSYSAMKQNTKSISQFFKQYSKSSCYLGLIPTACEIYKDELPTQRVFNQQQAIAECYESIPDASGIDLYGGLSGAKEDRLFYHSDTRWTSAGAFIGYNEIAKTMGETPVNEALFNIEHAAYDYYGNLSRELCLTPDVSDTIDIYHYSRQTPVTKVEKISGGQREEYTSILFRDFLESGYQQSVFLGYDTPLTRIETNLDNGKKLLLFGDSLSDSLMQFLPLHYEEILFVDLTTVSKDDLRQINPDRYNTVLFLYSMETYLNSNAISVNLEQLMKQQSEREE
ncbi:MAG: DHHW family protein [Massiliimalia sp.]|jgi:hypothetical protein